MSWKIVFTNHAITDSQRIESCGLKPNVSKLLAVIRENPYSNPPPFEKLLGELSGAYSRRINIQHRLVYQVLKDIKTLKIIRMWTRYE